MKCVRILVDNFTARSPLQVFDLSQNKSLRALQVTASSIDRALSGGSLDAASMLLKYAISTIASPVHIKVMIIYRDYDFRGIAPRGNSNWPYLSNMSEADRAEETLRHRRRFKVLREVHKVRDFQLVLHAEVWSPVVEYSVRMLGEAVADEKVTRGFEGFRSEPVVTYRPRTPPPLTLRRTFCCRED